MLIGDRERRSNAEDSAKALHTVRDEANQIKLELVDLRTQTETSKGDLERKQASWDEMAERYETELGDLKKRERAHLVQRTLSRFFVGIDRALCEIGVEGIELPDHPFFVATAFQPQVGSGHSGVVHPLIAALQINPHEPMDP